MADLKAASTVTLLAMLYEYVPTSDWPGVEVERHVFSDCQPQRSGGAVMELLLRTRASLGGSDETTKSC